MPVSPSFPAPSFPGFPHGGLPRHDAVSPNFPEFPQQAPPPVSPPSLERRGNGETGGDTGRGSSRKCEPTRLPDLVRTRATYPSLAPKEAQQ